MRLILIIFLCLLAFFADRPDPGWTTPANVTRVIDGDTIEIEIRRTMRVRLIDCWAPERNTSEGPAATANLRRLVGNGNVTLFVPLKSGDVSELFTFGRILGHVWPEGSNRSLSELQVDQGFATKEKKR